MKKPDIISFSRFFSTYGLILLFWLLLAGTGSGSPNCPNGICENTEDHLTCAADCGNLLKNPSFEDGIDPWTGPSDSISVEPAQDGTHSLLINNTDGSHIYKRQEVDIDPFSSSPLYYSYRVKVDSFKNNPIVGMKIHLTYEDDDTDWIRGSPMLVDAVTDGQWICKENIIIPEKPIRKIWIYLYSLSGASKAYFDDIEARFLPPGDDLLFSNVNANLTLNTNGYVKSLFSDGQTALSSSVEPFSEMELTDGTITSSKSITALGNDHYRIAYLNTPVEVKFEIKPGPYCFLFEITGVSDPGDVDKITFINLQAQHVAQDDAHKEWAEKPSDDQLFLLTLPLNSDTDCIIDSSSYSCFSSKWLNLIGAAAALITVPKTDYFFSINDLIINDLIMGIDLPYVQIHGHWLRESAPHLRSYLFDYISQDNYLPLLHLAQRGRFKRVLSQGAMQSGAYNSPGNLSHRHRFDDFNRMKTAISAFTNEGIEFGIHQYFGRVFPGDNDDDADSFFKAENIFKVPVANLQDDIGPDDLTIVLDTDLDENEDFQHYKKYNNGGDEYYFLIESGTDWEIVKCTYDHETLSAFTVNGQRALYNTGYDPEPGDQVSFLPRHSINFYIAPEAIGDSAASFAHVFSDHNVNISFLYLDGKSGIAEPGMDEDEKRSYLFKNFDLPYAKAFEAAGAELPDMQFGGGDPGLYDFYFSDLVASYDAAIFKSKEFTRNFKIDWKIRPQSHYALKKYELGWWKITGARFSEGYDHDATTPDDVHYAMTKALAFGTSMGLQLGEIDYADKDKALAIELFDIIGSYHDLMALDHTNNIVPELAKEYLRDPDKEAELVRTEGQYQLIEKEVGKFYATWDGTSRFSSKFTNRFANQPLQVEIRPRFDYYGFNESENDVLADLENMTLEFTSSDPNDVTCEVSDGSTLIITNNIADEADTIGICKMSIQLPHSFDLASKRGIGLSITGDGSGPVVVVHLDQDSGLGCRDFKTTVDFTGKRELILGDPTTDLTDLVPGDNDKEDWGDWDYNKRHRSWGYNWSSGPNLASIYVYVNPGTYKLRFHQLKALFEKKGGSTLVNPSITVNGNAVVFPVELSFNDSSGHILSYNGFSGEYKVFTSNYTLVDQGTILQDNIIVGAGINAVEVSSDTSRFHYSARADIRIAVVDDEDGDQVPTNGDYDPNSYTPCNGTGGFCDDNCPEQSNPDQRDKDGDGIGDECDT